MAEYIEKWSVVNRLIDLENEFQQYKPFQGFEHAMYRKVCEVEISIGKTQAADIAPVRHGKWEKTADGAALCTACKRKMNPSLYGYAFCGLCGAKMDEVSE